MENKYANAIRRSMTRDFFLGYGEYHIGDREWSDQHNPSSTFFYINEYYNQLNNSDLFLRQFSQDIKNILESKLTTEEFLIVLTYIYIYIRRNIEEKTIEKEWKLDNETKMLIKKHYEQFKKLYSTKINEQFKVNSSNNGFNLYNITAKINIIKDRFGIDLLDV